MIRTNLTNTLKPKLFLPAKFPQAERTESDFYPSSVRPKIIENNQNRKSVGFERQKGQINPYKSLEKIYSSLKKAPGTTYSNWTKNFDILA